MIDQVREKAAPVFKQHGVLRAALFGSMATGEATASSDVDILVQLKESASLFDFIRLKKQLETALGRKVDLVEYDAVRPTLRPFILEKPIDIYV